MHLVPIRRGFLQQWRAILWLAIGCFASLGTAHADEYDIALTPCLSHTMSAEEQGEKLLNEKFTRLDWDALSEKHRNALSDGLAMRAWTQPRSNYMDLLPVEIFEGFRERPLRYLVGRTPNDEYRFYESASENTYVLLRERFRVHEDIKRKDGARECLVMSRDMADPKRSPQNITTTERWTRSATHFLSHQQRTTFEFDTTGEYSHLKGAAIWHATYLTTPNGVPNLAPPSKIVSILYVVRQLHFK